MKVVLQSILIATAMIAVGCTSSSTSEPPPVGSVHPTLTPGHPTVKWVLYRANGLSFIYPVDWKAKGFEGSHSSFETPLVYLSNQEMSDPCTNRPGSRVCHAYPIKALDPGGVVLVWSTNGFPGWDFAQQRGRAITVGGRAAKITARRDCGHLVADRSVSVIIPFDQVESTPAGVASSSVDRPSLIDTPNNWYELDACFRDPGADAALDQVRRLLRSVQLSGP